MNKLTNDLKTKIKFVSIPLLLGTLVGFISNFGKSKDFVSPSFAPPDYLFPIVWSILYILMGISAYIVHKSNDKNKKDALKTYYISLAINLSWSILFFNLNLYLFSFFYLILLIVFVILMIVKYFRINKIASYLQIPYLIWILFAAVLNYSIYLLNR